MNRIRVILAEHNKTNKWLAEQLGKSETTVSRWVQNKNQPSITQLVEIAKVLEIDAKRNYIDEMIKFIDLFAGLGGIRIGFTQAAQELNLETECVFTSEIKPSAIKAISYNSIHSTKLDRLIEVKTYRGNPHFHWSSNEMNEAKLRMDHYYLYLVSYDEMNKEGYHPIIIQNPINYFKDNAEWQTSVDSVTLTKI